MSYKDFFVERVDRGDRYSIDAEVVSRAVFDRRRITECYHRWTTIPGRARELICTDCKLTRPNEAVRRPLTVAKRILR